MTYRLNFFQLATVLPKYSLLVAYISWWKYEKHYWKKAVWESLSYRRSNSTNGSTVLKINLDNPNKLKPRNELKAATILCMNLSSLWSHGMYMSKRWFFSCTKRFSIEALFCFCRELNDFVRVIPTTARLQLKTRPQIELNLGHRLLIHDFLSILIRNLVIIY